MSIINNIINKLTFTNLIPFLINLIFCTIIILFLLGIVEIVSEKYRENKIKGLIKQNKTIDKIKGIKFLKSYATNLEIVLKEKDKEGAFDLIFYSTLIICGIVLISLITVKQVLLAILSPIIILILSNEICLKLSIDIIESIEEQLPFAIDNIIRISTKYSDIKSIIYESSRTCEQPMKSILENISREMLSSPTDKVLMDYAKKYDNVWFYSMVFSLVSYLEDASKEDTINNLKNLRNILEKENTVKKASVTDKRYSVMVNLVVSLAGVLGFFMNLLITPNAKEFFFSTFVGLVCFISGFAFVIITIFINIKMSKIQKK